MCSPRFLQDLTAEFSQSLKRVASADILRVKMGRFRSFVLCAGVPFINKDSLDDHVGDSSKICGFVFPEDLFFFFCGFSPHKATKEKDKILRRNWAVLVLPVSYKSLQQAVWTVEEFLNLI